jgi:hypothetical protein
VTLTVNSTATPGRQATSPVCILLVNPLKSQALLVNSGAQLSAPTCEVHVASTQSPAAIFNTTLNVKRICIKGSTVDQNATITFNGNVNANLSAPTTGTYANILMFEPSGLGNTNLPINGTSGSSFRGLLYLPSRDVTINSVSNVSSNSVTMVFSTLILNATNWTIAPGALSMSVATGASTSAYLSR